MSDYFVKKIDDRLFLLNKSVNIGDYIFGLREGGRDTEHYGKVIRKHKINYCYVYDSYIDEGEYCEGIIMLYECGRMVGEISRDSLKYVKEGKEFNRKDWKLCFNFLSKDFLKVKIKCPYGHFH